jgi:hypothetical protein
MSAAPPGTGVNAVAISREPNSAPAKDFVIIAFAPLSPAGVGARHGFREPLNVSIHSVQSKARPGEFILRSAERSLSPRRVVGHRRSQNGSTAPWRAPSPASRPHGVGATPRGN